MPNCLTTLATIIDIKAQVSTSPSMMWLFLSNGRWIVLSQFRFMLLLLRPKIVGAIDTTYKCNILSFFSLPISPIPLNTPTHPKNYQFFFHWTQRYLSFDEMGKDF